jgi:hypothetical protein
MIGKDEWKSIYLRPILDTHTSGEVTDQLSNSNDESPAQPDIPVSVFALPRVVELAGPCNSR